MESESLKLALVELQHKYDYFLAKADEVDEQREEFSNRCYTLEDLIENLKKEIEHG